MKHSISSISHSDITNLYSSNSPKSSHINLSFTSNALFFHQFFIAHLYFLKMEWGHWCRRLGKEGVKFYSLRAREWSYWDIQCRQPLGICGQECKLQQIHIVTFSWTRFSCLPAGWNGSRFGTNHGRIY